MARPRRHGQPSGSDDQRLEVGARRHRLAVDDRRGGALLEPGERGQGDFSVKANLTEPKQSYNHQHPYGVLIGGKGLDTETPQALYCAAYRNEN